jgi:hypothetical protein
LIELFVAGMEKCLWISVTSIAFQLGRGGPAYRESNDQWRANSHERHGLSRLLLVFHNLASALEFLYITIKVFKPFNHREELSGSGSFRKAFSAHIIGAAWDLPCSCCYDSKTVLASLLATF